MSRVVWITLATPANTIAQTLHIVNLHIAILKFPEGPTTSHNNFHCFAAPAHILSNQEAKMGLPRIDWVNIGLADM
jgi:hypothetical protein